MNDSTLSFLYRSLNKRLLDHDWTYNYSDSADVRNRGNMDWSQIINLASDIGPKGFEKVIERARESAPDFHPAFRMVNAKEPVLRLPKKRFWRKLKDYYLVEVGDKLIANDDTVYYIKPTDNLVGKNVGHVKAMLPVRTLSRLTDYSTQ